MAFVRCSIIFAVVLVMVNSTPVPEPKAQPGWKHEHHHAIIAAPYHVHNVHHHHVEKVAVPVPIVKKVVVHDHLDLHHHDLLHSDLHHHHDLLHGDLHHHGLHSHNLLSHDLHHHHHGAWW
ncbi:unnamed protein product [Brassicogethes aeneus]|uniref:Histidine-rich glycoprotein n=1 Tax=Brassicogethes aeneus TaxID=1431903 RepID=A0A9P0BI34_BRAAE|nr:unnamed protein product [Brassicogethes aeneus]